MITAEELRRMYHDEGMTQKEIGNFIGVSSHTISRWMLLYSIESRICSESHSVNSSKPSKEYLIKMYHDEKMMRIDIADLFGVSDATISNWMKSYDIKLRTISESHAVNSKKPSEKYLREMYCVDKMTQMEIAKDIGVDAKTVLNWMREYGIESRAYSDYAGENSSGWKGGISFEPYCYKFDNGFKEAVRARDGYTCQLCGCEQNGMKLDVHHVHYTKEDCYPDVVALCRSCHAKTTSGDRDYWEKYFENQIVERGLMYWSLSNIA